MALKLEDKKTIVADLAKVVQTSVSAIAADYRGLTVSEMTELRKKARDAQVVMGVYKNTLARRAVQETAFACLSDALRGPIVLLFSQDEPGLAARILRDFIKTHENLKVRALAMDGVLLAADRLESVASLPSRHEALTQVVVVMKAPIVQLARTLQEPYAMAVRVLAAIRDQKQAAA